MNRWAQMLAELPALAQRQIARYQRISLPRRCDTATRLTRLRRSLCRAATVRAVYASLPPATQNALQYLCTCRAGIRPDQLTERFGSVRSWRQIAADLSPRSISEELLLLGWLLPRPATPRHPAHYLVPPEVRRSLPAPLTTTVVPPPTPALPALRAATTMLLAAAERPLNLTQAHALRRPELRRVQLRLVGLASDTAALLGWLLPLLLERELLSVQGGVATLTLLGQRFLALAPAQQHALLLASWVGSPRADSWLLRLRVDPRGIDWPLLRRQLCGWGAAAGAFDTSDVQARYTALASRLGPLADAHTHGFRTVDRVPWQARRAAVIFDAALHGVLAWLGLVGAPPASGASSSDAEDGADAEPDGSPALTTTEDEPPAAPFVLDRLYRMRNGPRRTSTPRRRPRVWRWPSSLPSDTEVASEAESEAHKPVRWQYGAAGIVCVPHAAQQHITLRLLPFVRWEASDATTMRYRVTAATLARARARGWSAQSCWQLLEAQAGPPPAGWCAVLPSEPPAPMRLEHTTVLLVDEPALLERAARARSVRRYLAQRVAPGIALVRPEHVAPLQRALERQALICQMSTKTTASGPDAAANLSAGERAALVIACAYYRQHVPNSAPLLPHDGLEARLRAGLSLRLNAAIDAALAELHPPPKVAEPPATPDAQQHTLTLLRQALAKQLVEITYDTGGQGQLNRRTVRPLNLEQRDDIWYLRAYCTARQAERTFRIDRIWSCSDEEVRRQEHHLAAAD